MISRVLWLVPVLLAPAAAPAETFTSSEFGYSIDIDDSYRLTRDDGATYFRSQQDSGLVVIRNWPGLDAETAKSYLQEGYQDARLAIVPDGGVEELAVDDGKGFLVSIKGVAEREAIRGLAAGLVGDKGQGMIVVFSGSDADWDRLAPVARRSVESVKFIEFRTTPAASDWNHMLAGTRLSFRGNVDEDRRVREDLNLCGDGRFRHRIASSAIRDSDTGSSIGHSAKTRSGVWRVVEDDGTNRLLLLYDDGRKESGVIEKRDGALYIDGRNYMRSRKSSCR